MSQTLHLVSLPHTETTSAFSICAYSMKIVKFCRMMQGLGRRIVLYSGEENEAPCDEHVTLLSSHEREQMCGVWNPQHPFTQLSWDPTKDPFRTMNERAIVEIRKRAEPTDLVLLIAGLAQKPIADALKPMLAIEWGVGYEGVFSDYRAYESYAWMHYLYGKYGVNDGRYYDSVIPNFFDRTEFTPSLTSGSYLLFVGRLTTRKGPHVAAQIAERVGMPLMVAGPGAHLVESLDARYQGDRITADGVIIEGPGVHYVGPVGVAERAALMAGAAALIAPTLYLEPFGGVAVEAMLSGTPVVASDWGAFPEIVDTGLTGYRFRTLQQGVEAVQSAMQLNREQVLTRATSRFSLEAVAPLYTRWFDQLDGLWGAGWGA